MPDDRPTPRGVGGRRPGGGFTLLEVLVALAILAITLGALVKAGSEHARNTHYLQERTLAHWAGQNLLARYEAGLLAAERGATVEGTVQQAGQDWDYRLEITEEQPVTVVEFPVDLPAVLRIEIIVWLAGSSPADARARIQGYLLP